MFERRTKWFVFVLVIVFLVLVAFAVCFGRGWPLVVTVKNLSSWDLAEVTISLPVGTQSIDTLPARKECQLEFPRLSPKYGECEFLVKLRKPDGSIVSDSVGYVDHSTSRCSISFRNAPEPRDIQIVSELLE